MGERSESRSLAPIAILILGLLAERPMHPYEMFQLTIDRREDRLLKVRPGTMYHTVDRLSAQELIEVHEIHVVVGGVRPLGRRAGLAGDVGGSWGQGEGRLGRR